MDFPLLLRTVLYRAATVYPEKEIVSRDFSGTFRYTYRDLHKRVCKLANALDALGLERGAHVASFAWNNHRHLELYYAVPCSERVLHTTNIRLYAEQVVYTVNHAEDQIMFVDEDLLPTLAALADRLPTIKTWVVMTDKSELPDVHLDNIVLYEDLIAHQPDTYNFPLFDENTPAIIGYTSATTGDPKGVVYSHRGLYLHCLSCLTGEVAPQESDVAMAIVPMFHVNAWGHPYIDTWIGAKQVYPGQRPSPQILCELISSEKVTFSVGVPTVWMGVLEELRRHPRKYQVDQIRYLISGGSAMPFGLTKAYQEEFGIKLYQGYGQTETSPVTFSNAIKSSLDSLTGDDLYNVRTKTGLILPGLEMKIIDREGNEVSANGRDMGELLLRGPWVISEYYKNPEKTREAFIDGWFRTGDIATLDEHGYLQVVDRTKDLIKSGGEWISSVDLENAMMSHPGVAEAAVIGIPDEKWQERPLACVVLRPEAVGTISQQDLTDYLAGRVAKWWIPNDFRFVKEIPKTSVGKFAKRVLRDQYQEGSLDTL